jgi:chromosome segregation ATPase
MKLFKRLRERFRSQRSRLEEIAEKLRLAQEKATWLHQALEHGDESRAAVLRCLNVLEGHRKALAECQEDVSKILAAFSKRQPDRVA